MIKIYDFSTCTSEKNQETPGDGKTRKFVYSAKITRNHRNGNVILVSCSNCRYVYSTSGEGVVSVVVCRCECMYMFVCEWVSLSLCVCVYVYVCVCVCVCLYVGECLSLCVSVCACVCVCVCSGGGLSDNFNMSMGWGERWRRRGVELSAKMLSRWRFQKHFVCETVFWRICIETFPLLYVALPVVTC